MNAVLKYGCVCLPGINELRQREIFRILSGILHLGSVEITAEERAVDRSLVKVGPLNDNAFIFPVLR